MLIILKVNVNLCKFIPKLLLAGTHPPIAGIKHHDVFKFFIHQIHDDIIIVFGLSECLRQREQLPEAHPLRLLVLGCGECHVSVLEAVKQRRVSGELRFDVDLSAYQGLY